MKSLTITLLLFISVISYGQKTWKKADINPTSEVISIRLPNAYQLYNIDINKVKQQLNNAPKRFQTSLDDTRIILTLPNEAGKSQRFKILEAPMMEQALADKFPMIKTYVGQGIDDPTAVLNLSIGTDGLHAMIRAAGKSPFFIDPYTKDRTQYMAYSKADMPRRTGDFPCGFKNERATGAPAPTTGGTRNITDGLMREYNLAVATTIEYSDFHLTNQGVANTATDPVKKAAVLSAITTTVNRVKGIYETELGITFVLNANSESIIFLDTDNFTNSSSSALINESQTEIDNEIGNANYDIGHTFSTGGGGVASLGGICTTTNKARAITGSSSPIGDSYDVDFVAHEIGHHFGANHTYNGINNIKDNDGNIIFNGVGDGNCTTFNTSTAAEPGSGTTIMAYAGICGSTLNVESNSDPYFHVFSLKEINERLTNTGGFTNSGFYTQCSNNTNTGNQEPVANAGSDYTIPNGTAFILTGSATDPDGDAMTYCWDQLDLAQPNVYPLASTTTTGPLYRSLTPSSSSERYMPAFETVFNGSLQSTWEVTPTVARTLNFNLAVRDNKAVGGQSTSDDMVVTVASVGPFQVTSNTTEETWTTGESKTITWDVAGTDANGINVANVEITLVNSSGTVLSTLVASTPNDGSHTITVPNIIDNNTRIMVKAIGNIFYAVNSAIIAVNTTPGYCNSVCASSGGTLYPDGTTLVNFANINQVSTGAPAYTDYTAVSTDVTRGQAYNLTINVNTDGSYLETTKVWIDWNRNCDLTDSGEEYDLGDALNVSDGPTANSPLSITIPANAELGETRMRVTSAYHGGGFDPTPCATNFAGEVEDYTINVVAALPVELINFTAKAKNNKAIQLDWNTASESNNTGFEIERSKDGKVFNRIGWVEGNGTSLDENIYQYLDEQVNRNQRYYYRLKQIDADGTFSYSSIQTAILLEEGGNVLVYPNPASDMITIDTDEALLQRDDVTFQLFNTLGQVVFVSVIESIQTTISVQDLPVGVYFYKVINQNKTIKSERLIIR